MKKSLADMKPVDENKAPERKLLGLLKHRRKSSNIDLNFTRT